MGTVVAAVLLYLGKTKANKGLTVYSAILIPVFAVCSLLAVRAACVSKNRIYRKCDKLVVKSFFLTRHFIVSDIERLTAAHNEKTGITSVNITYRGKTAKYRSKSLKKEEIAHLRRAAS